MYIAPDTIITSTNGSVLFFLFLLVFGYGILLICRKMKWPAPILLFVVGLIAKIFISRIDLMPFMIIAFVLLLFDAGSRFIPRKFDTNALKVAEFIIYVFISYLVIFLFLFQNTLFDSFSLSSVLIAVIFAALLSACSQFEVLKFFKMKKSRLYNLTEMEDHLSNPMVMVIVIFGLSFFFFLDKVGSLLSFIEVLKSLFIDISVGVFFGMIMLYFAVKVLKRRFVSIISILFSIGTYFIAVAWGGMGFIAVIVLSFFFHNVISKLPDMDEFTPFVNNLIYIFVFIAMGFTVNVSFNMIVCAVVIFVLYISVRHIVLSLTLHKKKGSCMTLDCSKGLMVGAFLVYVLLIRMIYVPSELQYLMNIFIFITIFSILVSYLNDVVIRGHK